MPSRKRADADFAITGLGVTSAIGQGALEFGKALFDGRHGFATMQRPGRQKGTAFLGAELDDQRLDESLAGRPIRNASLSARAAVATLQEVWQSARLNGVDPLRIGLIIGGSNLEQRELMLAHESHRERPRFIRPTYGVSFMDSDLVGLCTEQFGIRGPSCTVGGASASGQVAILHAIRALESQDVDVCIAMGALTDLSFWELQALRSLGAMGTDRFATEPSQACRPFDAQRDGCIYGEACAAVAIERLGFRPRSEAPARAIISGWAMVMDGNRKPNPSLAGETLAIERALTRAGLDARDIDYVNPHGTGSRVGDEIELSALRCCGLESAFINATKSLTGHGLSAAGALEVVATVLQMEASKLHPTRNLEEPIDDAFNWVRQAPMAHQLQRALSSSLGFGGVNTALCIERYH